MADVKHQAGSPPDPASEMLRLLPHYLVHNSTDDARLRTALRELERRARVERRLEKWLREDGELRSRTQSNVSVKLKDYRRDREWFAVRGVEAPSEADDWTLTDLALDAAGAPKESE